MKHIPRVYTEDLEDEEFRVPSSGAHHLISVLRMKCGAEFVAFNAKDGEWLCYITSITRATVTAMRRSFIRQAPVLSRRVAVAFCLIKHDAMRLIVEKGTELGATDFFPLTSRYSMGNINVEKLTMVAIGATEQSERFHIPKIHDIQELTRFIRAQPGEFKWISAVERTHDISKVTPIMDTDLTGSCGFIIGPEGGFSDDEKALLLANTTAVTLSENILRSETAAIACLAA
ncbi:MAG: 16S rRNA (uracil(1498)-N(3))-methyltransferase, partial [Holosporales bacterium]|nr:16S rRNA (uracil(1498)-N(3))-methyltransferase [Holosporales bacterium]